MELGTTASKQSKHDDNHACLVTIADLLTACRKVELLTSGGVSESNYPAVIDRCRTIAQEAITNTQRRSDDV
jgi:hypothetical protein